MSEDPWDQPYGMINGVWVAPPCGCPEDRDCPQCYEGTAGWPRLSQINDSTGTDRL